MLLLSCAFPQPNSIVLPSPELLNHQNTGSAATFIASEDHWQSEEEIFYSEGSESDFLIKETGI